MKWIALAFVFIIFLPYQANSEEYWKTIPYPSFMRSYGSVDEISAIAVEPSGTIWIGDMYGNVYCYRSREWTQIPKETMGISNNKITGIMVDSKQRVWFSTQSGENNRVVTVLYDKNQWKTFDFSVMQEDTIGSSLQYPFQKTGNCAEDKDGMMWFSGDGGVIQLYPDMSYRIFNIKNSGLPDNKVDNVVVDGSNVKWFTVNGILVSYDGFEWKVHNKPHVDGFGDYIARIAPSKENGVCCGLLYLPSGAVVYNGNTWWHVPGDITGSGGGNIIRDIAADSNGAFWLLVFHDFAHNSYFKGIMKLYGNNVEWYDLVNENKEFFSHLCIGSNNNKYFISNDGIKIFSENSPVQVNETEPRPFCLGKANPNPFNPSTTLSFTLPAYARAELVVFSITGQRVRTLLNGVVTAGSHSIIWDGRDDHGNAVSSGVYLSRFKSGNQIATGKMLLLR